MKTLLDEQLDVRFQLELKDCDVRTLGELGWLGLKNGELRERLNENGFDFFLSADKNLPFQQNFEKIKFTVGLLDTPSLLWPYQQLFVPKLLQFLNAPPSPLPKIAYFSLEGISKNRKVEALKNLVGADQILFV